LIRANIQIYVYLSNGIDIADGWSLNQKLFLGYATTSAAREGNIDVLKMLLLAGATQEACEDALSEACLFGEVEAVRILVSSEMLGIEAMARALVTACSRGFDDISVILLQVLSLLLTCHVENLTIYFL
jgi:hypothetical protein